MNNAVVRPIDPLNRNDEPARLDRAAAHAMFADPGPRDMWTWGEAADRVRRQRHGLRATFVNNLQINPCNVCVRDCKFCGYASFPNEPGAYSLDEAEIMATVEQAEPTEVHIVGGLNHIWTYERSLNLIRRLRNNFPDLYIKCFTAIEIHWFASVTRYPIDEILTSFRQAGMNSLPGGGAEIFSEVIRQRYFRHKIGADDWLAVHETAHGLGIPSNATMLYGLGESWADRIRHLLRLRELQDRSGGFKAFIPLALQPGKIGRHPRSPTENLAVIAMARLLLDNFDHVKAYWPMIGTETAAAALSFGADDLDGTIGLEKIAHASGADTPRQVARAEMQRLIRMAGFEAVERDGAFQAMPVLVSA